MKADHLIWFQFSRPHKFGETQNKPVRYFPINFLSVYNSDELYTTHLVWTGISEV